MNGADVRRPGFGGRRPFYGGGAFLGSFLGGLVGSAFYPGYPYYPYY